jgi:hypothetical protein
MELELPVRCLCAHCGAKLQLPLSKFGARARCPECNRPTTLTIEHQPVQAFSEALSSEQVRAAFGRSPDLLPPPKSKKKGVCEVLAAAVAVSAGLGYLGMVGIAAWGVWICIDLLSWVLGGTDVGLFLFELKLLACVVCIGLGVLFFLLISKPLLAGRARRSSAFRTSPELEAGLHALVKRVSELTGAPRPTAIVLNLAAEVSVDFPWPWRKAPVISVGLPLLATLQLSELAGIIASELGRFSRGAGAWQSRTAHWISTRFQRALHEQDAWDLWIGDSLRNARNPVSRLVFGLFSDCVAGHRRCLQWFWYLSMRVRQFLPQPAEKEAEWWSLRISGSAAKVSAGRRIRFLRMVLRRAYAELRPAWEARHRLPDNFTAYVLWQEGRLGPAFWERSRQERVHAEEDSQKREGSVKQAVHAGMISMDGPALGLCPRYESISRSLTQSHYREDLRLEFHDSCLEPVSSFVTAMG